MENETLRKLNVLLRHWMEHNQEHAAEYEKWALKAKAEGFAELDNALKGASDGIRKTNEKLADTLELAKILAKK